MVKVIGMVGDSIAHGFYDEENLGWFARLGQMVLNKYSGQYVFNNLAQSGDNVVDAANRVVGEVLSRQFDLILVNVGINDLRRRKDSDLQLDFSEGVRRVYWDRLLGVLEKTGAKIVVIDLMPVVESRYTPEASLARYNSDVERYNKLIGEECAKRGVMFFERYDEWIMRDLKEFYKDATHPNAKGHQLIAEEVFSYLEKEKLL